MRTLVISDLHLGRTSATDLLRRADLREPLLEAVRGADRLVILGDGLELREAPQREAARIAAPVFAELGAALGRDGELVIVAGNHDHALAAVWIDARLQAEPPGFLGLEQFYEPRDGGPLAELLADAAAPARVRFAYPGMWLADGVYAFHGHYSDIHTTVPTFERLVAGAMARFVAPLPPTGQATSDDYEAALAPLYAWMLAVTQRADHGVVSASAGASARTWVALTGRDRHRRPLRTLALGTGYASAVFALNRIGIGPLDRDLSPAALRRGYLHGIAEVIQRLGLGGASHVIWGHSHRSGPWPMDDAADWTAPGGARILNTGSWVYQRHFLSEEPNRSPYWPGTAVEIEDGGEPRLIRLLGERGHEERRPRPA